MGSGVSKKPFSYVSLASNIPSRSPLPLSLHSSRCVCNACVYACVRVSARLQGKREGWAFILLLPVLLEQIYRLSIALRYPDLIGTPINELFNRFLSCVFQIFLRMLFFFYTVRNRSVKYILIVPRYRKIS